MKRGSASLLRLIGTCVVATILVVAVATLSGPIVLPTHRIHATPGPVFNYDAPAALTTTALTAHSTAFLAYDDPAQRSHGAVGVLQARLAAEGGVYSLRNAAGEVVRTGRTNNLARRAAEHARDEELASTGSTLNTEPTTTRLNAGSSSELDEQYSPPLNKINALPEDGLAGSASSRPC